MRVSRLISLGAVFSIPVAALAVVPAFADSSPATWSELKTAFSSVTSGNSSVVTLSANIDDSDTDGLSVLAGATITLNLNGHVLTIDQSAQAGIAVPHTATLNIEDLAGSGVFNVTGANENA